MIPSSQIAIREQQRAELNDAIARHLAQGGSIDRLSHAERAPYRNISYGRVPSQRGKH